MEQAAIQVPSAVTGVFAEQGLIWKCSGGCTKGMSSMGKEGSSMWLFLGLIQLFLGMSVDVAVLQWLFGSSGAGFMVLAGYFMLSKSPGAKDFVSEYNKDERSAISRNNDGQLVDIPIKGNNQGFQRLLTIIWFFLLIFGLFWKGMGS